MSVCVGIVRVVILVKVVLCVRLSKGTWDGATTVVGRCLRRRNASESAVPIELLVFILSSSSFSCGHLCLPGRDYS